MRIFFVLPFLAMPPAGLYAMSASATLSVSVDPVNQVHVRPLGHGVQLDTRDAGSGSYSALSFEVDNNSPNGFYVTISSTHRGALVSEETDHQIAYVVSTTQNPSTPRTIIGSKEPDSLRAASLEKPAVLRFDQGVHSASQSRGYTLSITPAVAVHAPKAVYRDNVVIDIYSL